MPDFKDITLDSQGEIFRELQSAHLEMANEILQADNGNMFAFDLFAGGIFHR